LNLSPGGFEECKREPTSYRQLFKVKQELLSSRLNISFYEHLSVYDTPVSFNNFHISSCSILASRLSDEILKRF